MPSSTAVCALDFVVMRRALSLLLGFVLFVPVATAATFFVFGASIEITQPWGIRSAPPPDAVPPSFLSRLPWALGQLLVGFALFVVSALIAKSAINAQRRR
jgi:hypothetical protein